MTLDVYSHVLLTLQEGAMAQMNALLTGSSPEEATGIGQEETPFSSVSETAQAKKLSKVASLL